MSNHDNHRRGEQKRTEHGVAYENGNPGKGCNSTHVARAHSWWGKYRNRALRRNGNSGKFYSQTIVPEEE